MKLLNPLHFNYLKAIVVSCIIVMLPSISIAQTLSEPNLNNMPISIDADNQQIDIQKNTMTFSGNVVIIQDKISIKANKVVITEIQSQNNQVITAYGKPVFFEQTIEKDGTHYTITGRADRLVYEVKNNNVVMNGNAEIIQRDNRITSDLITYNVEQRKIQAQSNEGHRVKTTIHPNQIREIER